MILVWIALENIFVISWLQQLLNHAAAPRVLTPAAPAASATSPSYPASKPSSVQTQVTLPIAQLAAALASQQNRAATPLLQQATPQGALTQQATPLTQQATPLTPLYVTPQQLAQLATEGSALTLEKTETAEAEPTEKVKETNGDANEEDEKETEEKDMMLEIVVMEAEDQDQLPVHEQSHALLFGEWQANFLNQVR